MAAPAAAGPAAPAASPPTPTARPSPPSSPAVQPSHDPPSPNSTVQYSTSARTFTVGFTLPKTEEGKQETLQLPVVVTKPEQQQEVWPVVVMFNGFQCKARYYQHIAEYLAGSGFLVLQYTTPSFRIIPDRDELPFLDQLLTWAQAPAGDEPTNFVTRAADLTRVCVTGHSRGAKLAALQFARKGSIRAAALLDPVNNTDYTPESAEYPNACAALAAAGRPFGIVGAGRIGSGNPKGSNWETFYEAAPAGSWLAVVQGAAHGTFCKANCVTQAFVDLLFGGGKVSRQQVLDNVGPPLVRWFRSQLEGGTEGQASGAINGTHTRLQQCFGTGVSFTAKSLLSRVSAEAAAGTGK